LPEDAATLLASSTAAIADAHRFLRFRPPRINLDNPAGDAPALPHIRLDRAIDFLIGDRLA
jgi:uncharacterized protein